MSTEVFERELSKVKDQFGMDSFKRGWFAESCTVNGNVVNAVKVDKVLFHERSKYQDVCIFESKVFGRVLALDDAIQLTEKDEWAHQEMAVFIPLNSHPNPKKVLIIGGGVGGTVREVTKHPLVESITVCEIDQVVIEASKKYLPFMAKGFESPKLTVHVGDGAEYMKKHKGEFDVIITDSPDPKGPALSLFKRSYYESLKQALKPGGIIVSQGEGFWFHLPVTKELVAMARSIFPVVDYFVSYVGSFPGGHLGFLLCSNSASTNFRNPTHLFSAKDLTDMNLKYYTPAIHKASMALPFFLAEHGTVADKEQFASLLNKVNSQLAGRGEPNGLGVALDFQPEGSAQIQILPKTHRVHAVYALVKSVVPKIGR